MFHFKDRDRCVSSASLFLAFASMSVENVKFPANSCFIERLGGTPREQDSEIGSFLYLWLWRMKLYKQCLVSVNNIIFKPKSGSGCSGFKYGVAASRTREGFSTQTCNTVWQRGGDFGFVFNWNPCFHHGCQAFGCRWNLKSLLPVDGGEAFNLWMQVKVRFCLTQPPKGRGVWLRVPRLKSVFLVERGLCFHTLSSRCRLILLIDLRHHP